MPAGEPLRGRGAGNRPAAPATAYSGHHRLFFFFSVHLGRSGSLDQAKIYLITMMITGAATYNSCVLVAFMHGMTHLDFFLIDTIR